MQCGYNLGIDVPTSNQIKSSVFQRTKIWYCSWDVFTYFRSVDGFDPYFVFRTSEGNWPAPGICSLPVRLFFFHPHGNSVPKMKKNFAR